MVISAIAFEERVERVLEGLSSDPHYAIPVLVNMASLPLIEFFGGEERELLRVVKPLASERIKPKSSVGQVATALDRVWCRKVDEQRNVHGAVIAIASALAGTPETRRGEADNLRSRPSSAACGVFEHHLVTLVPLSERIDAIGGRRPSVVDTVAGLGYAAFLEAVDAVTGGFEKSSSISLLESRWSVDSGVTLSRIAQFCVENREEPDIICLLDAFFVKPFASLHAYHANGVVDGGFSNRE